MVEEKELFGRCHHQLILVALLMHPFGIKAAPRRRVLSHVPLSGVSQDSVAAYLSDDSAILGPPWMHSDLLGTSWAGFRPPQGPSWVGILLPAIPWASQASFWSPRATSAG